MFFKKSKNDNEDKQIDALTSDREHLSRSKSSSKGTTNAKIEKIDAQIEALKEVQSAQRERFERHSEEIGELRSTLADREKQIRELEAKAVRASELVAEVQPENFMHEQKKTDAKIEAIQGKLDNNEVISDSIIEELKKIKNKVSVFRGTEDILKLNKEVKEELSSIRKVEATVEKHSDHVEAIFTSFESNFEHFQKLKSDVKGTAEICTSLKKDVEKNSVLLNSLPKKEEIYHLRDSVNETLDNIHKEKDTYDNRNENLEISVANQKNDINKLTTNINDISDTLKNVSNGDIQKLSDNQESINGKISSIEHNILENTRKVNSMLTVLERFVVLTSSRLDQNEKEV